MRPPAPPLQVSVTSSDQSLNLETRESYTLEVQDPAILVQVGKRGG